MRAVTRTARKMKPKVRQRIKMIVLSLCPFFSGFLTGDAVVVVARELPGMKVSVSTLPSPPSVVVAAVVVTVTGSDQSEAWLSPLFKTLTLKL